MIKAVNDMQIKHTLCFIHTLQMVVTDFRTLKELDIRKIITNAKDIVTPFNTICLVSVMFSFIHESKNTRLDNDS